MEGKGSHETVPMPTFRDKLSFKGDCEGHRVCRSQNKTRKAWKSRRYDTGHASRCSCPWSLRAIQLIPGSRERVTHEGESDGVETHCMGGVHKCRGACHIPVETIEAN